MNIKLEEFSLLYRSLNGGAELIGGKAIARSDYLQTLSVTTFAQQQFLWAQHQSSLHADRHFQPAKDD